MFEAVASLEMWYLDTDYSARHNMRAAIFLAISAKYGAPLRQK